MLDEPLKVKYEVSKSKAYIFWYSNISKSVITKLPNGLTTASMPISDARNMSSYMKNTIGEDFTEYEMPIFSNEFHRNYSTGVSDIVIKSSELDSLIMSDAEIIEAEREFVDLSAQQSQRSGNVYGADNFKLAIAIRHRREVQHILSEIHDDLNTPYIGQ